MGAAHTETTWAGRRLHFVGLGGAGMSGLALIAAALGAEVSGSDRAASSYTERLAEHGILTVFGHAAANVPAGAEVVYSTAIAPDNPERKAAGSELHRADLLAEIAALRRCLAVTGTHGKTTTSAMVVQALQGAGLDPAYVVGGELRSTHSNAGWGSGEWIVVEADESDRSLLKLQPEIAVLTNAELDHHSTYRSRLDLEQTFATFMARAGERAVVWDRPGLRALCPGGGVPYDAQGAQLDPAGSASRCGCRFPAPTTRSTPPARSPHAPWPAPTPRPPPRRWRSSAAPAGAWNAWGRPPPAPRSMTTTPITPPRSPPRSPPPGRLAPAAWWPCSNPTSTRARARLRGDSARPWPAPT
jgi:hypothetical protein